MAALPMSAAVRLAQLGCQRLLQVSCRPWVLRRVGEVNFPTVVKAYQEEGCLKEAFCSEAVLKRLYGRIDDLSYEMEDPFPNEEIEDILSQVPGYIHFNHLGYNFTNFLMKLPSDTRCKVKYMTNLPGWFTIDFLKCFTNLVACCSKPTQSIISQHTCVSYRPALLNGRSVFDVLCALNAVSAPSGASEAELDYVRRKATDNARD